MQPINAARLRNLSFVAGLSIVAAFCLAEFAAADKGTPRNSAKCSDDESLVKLMQERRDELLACLTAIESTEETQFGITPFMKIVDLNRDLLDAELDLAKSHAERVAVYRRFLAEAKQQEERVAALHRYGARGGEEDRYHLAKVNRIEIQIELEREKRAAR